MKKPIKIAVWTVLVALALWISILALIGDGKPRKWQPTPEIGHRAAHKSGPPPSHKK